MHGHHEANSTPIAQASASAWALRIGAACLAGCTLAAILTWSINAPAAASEGLVKTPNPQRNVKSWYLWTAADVLVYRSPWYAGVLGQAPAPIKIIAITPLIVALPILATSLVIAYYGIRDRRLRTVQALQTA